MWNLHRKYPRSSTTRARRLHQGSMPLKAPACIRRVGFGCYRLDEHSAKHRATLTGAILSGVRLLDTAPNYSDGGSERLVGAVLARNHEVREQLCIVTKVGLLQGSLLAEAVVREQEGRPWPGMVKLSRSAWYCLSEEFIHHSVARSAERLGTQPDVVLLHNPEFILSHALDRFDAMGLASAKQKFYSNHLTGAFRALELLGLEYGISSNMEGCRWSVSGRQNNLEAVSMAQVKCKIAHAVWSVYRGQFRGQLLGSPDGAGATHYNGFQWRRCWKPHAQLEERITAAAYFKRP